jgi:tetratricopeptide (TPR) repeat protein
MKNYILVILCLILVAGCDDDFFDLKNPNEISTDTFYKSDNDAVLAANSVYAVLQNSVLWKRSYFVVLDGMSDDVKTEADYDDTDREMFRFTFDASKGRCNDFWKNLYEGIYRANQVIINIEDNPNISEDVALQVLAEAKFLRGYYYFQLASLWGGVPIVKELPTVSSYDIPRASQQEVYNFIESDLKFAEANLPMVSEYGAQDLGRATSGAASAFLGKAYLYQKRYKEAHQQFEKVVQTGKYDLVANYMDNFTFEGENNKESLFEVQFTQEGSDVWIDADSPDVGEHNFHHIIYWNWWKNVASDDLLWNTFEYKDPRVNLAFQSWSGRTFKYTEKNPSRLIDIRQSDINIRLMRYADLLLMDAEALIELGTDENLALATSRINDVRKRARDNSEEALGEWELPLLKKEMKQDELRKAVRHERRVELAVESHRYKDMVRWGIAHEILKDRGFVKGKHELFPIPDTEIKSNDGISVADQNPGY